MHSASIQEHAGAKLILAGIGETLSLPGLVCTDAARRLDDELNPR
ncbi:hypothetical protein [Micromonospora sp. NPDC049374]